jgi:hypothetical protein
MYVLKGRESGFYNFPRLLIAYKKYGENIRATGATEVFFPNYLRLIRLIQMG